MFEKIFGIFRKRKKSDVSQDIPGDLGDDTFSADTGMEEDFDADTISLETGMSGDSGFSDSGGASAGSQDLAVDETGQGLGLDDETAGAVADEAPGDFQVEAPLSPAPEVAAFTAPKKRGGRIKAALIMVAVVIIGLIAGFFSVEAVITMVQKALAKGPTPAEQLAALQTDNTQLEAQLTAYRAVGNIEAITAIRNELNKRVELLAQADAIETKVSDQPYVENRLSDVGIQLAKVNRELVIQRGALANVEKAVKQAEARNNYLISSTKASLEQIESARVRSDVLKGRLVPESVQRAESAGSLHYSIRKNLEESTSEIFPSS